MAKDPSNETVLSYYDCLLRASDVALLQGPHWLNDVIIGFYFEYLNETLNKNGKKEIYFISPELTQLLKMTDSSQYNIFLDPLNVSECKCIFFPLNNCDRKDAAGGSHWSLLIFCKQDKTCYHFDSSKGYNDCPQQDNGYDCGVYVLSLADVITKHVLKTGRIDGCNYNQIKKLVHAKRTELLNLINDLKCKSNVDK
ncbi:hypothetical protein QLX08_005416 [Tetragonisca angustula]|uniref:Ubiquitin-like protease family profile domain-containing protein n=1 Tax=Tetragonisca angustula TaxID=166442 RepID=A0AAW0ZYK8_9HYME